MLVLIFCSFVKGWKWGCLISHLFWTGRIREFWGLWIVHFDEDCGTIIFWHRKNSHDDNFCGSGSIFSPRLESCKAFFTLYLLDIKNQFALKHMHMVGPNYKLRKDIRYQLLTALNVQLNLYSWNWHDLKWQVRETRNENFTLLLGMGIKANMFNADFDETWNKLLWKKNPFPMWMGINGTTNSSHHLYSCDCNQLFLVKEGMHLQLTTKKSITKFNAISCTINIEGFGTIKY